jgi:prepilin-type N-terminal cleavage/methylation domain-containing protein
LKTLRPAFTLIEILISVLILSTSIVYILKIYGQNHEQTIYISQRNKYALQDSLFVSRATLQHHKEEKNAYDLLSDRFTIDKFKSRKILKKITRSIYIPQSQTMVADDTAGEGGGIPAAIIDEIKLKGEFSSSYFHFQIQSF